MMGVYVKGMEMPDDCDSCKVSDVLNCTLWKPMDIGERHPECPLVEVPTPHRRLIEEPETLCYAGLAKISTHDFRGEAEYFCKQVRAQSTVIEAEDE